MQNFQDFRKLHSLEGPLFPIRASGKGCGQKEECRQPFPLGKESVLLLQESRESHGPLGEARYLPSMPGPQVLVASFTPTAEMREAGKEVMLEALGVWPLPLVGLKCQACFYPFGSWLQYYYFYLVKYQDSIFL